jgi:hypothetical protein
MMGLQADRMERFKRLDKQIWSEMQAEREAATRRMTHLRERIANNRWNQQTSRLDMLLENYQEQADKMRWLDTMKVMGGLLPYMKDLMGPGKKKFAATQAQINQQVNQWTRKAPVLAGRFQEHLARLREATPISNSYVAGMARDLPDNPITRFVRADSNWDEGTQEMSREEATTLYNSYLKAAGDARKAFIEFSESGAFEDLDLGGVEQGRRNNIRDHLRGELTRIELGSQRFRERWEESHKGAKLPDYRNEETIREALKIAWEAENAQPGSGAKAFAAMFRALRAMMNNPDQEIDFEALFEKFER